MNKKKSNPKIKLNGENISKRGERTQRDNKLNSTQTEWKRKQPNQTKKEFPNQRSTNRMRNEKKKRKRGLLLFLFVCLWVCLFQRGGKLLNFNETGFNSTSRGGYNNKWRQIKTWRQLPVRRLESKMNNNKIMWMNSNWSEWIDDWHKLLFIEGLISPKESKYQISSSKANFFFSWLASVCVCVSVRLSFESNRKYSNFKDDWPFNNNLCVCVCVFLSFKLSISFQMFRTNV